MKKKKKTTFKEQTKNPGPFGVGATPEDIKNLNIFDFVTSSPAFREATKELEKAEKEHVLKETHQHAARYQEILEKIQEQLSTPEGRKKFQELAQKKASGK